jgi:hypothetical protein
MHEKTHDLIEFLDNDIGEGEDSTAKRSEKQTSEASLLMAFANSHGAVSLELADFGRGVARESNTYHI